MKSPHASKVLPDSHIDVHCLAKVFRWKESGFQAIQDCHVAQKNNNNLLKANEITLYKNSVVFIS